MECEEILQIQQKLQALCDALSATVPVAELHAHPFTANGKKIGRIVALIGQITEQALEERKALEDENLKLEDKIYLYCEQLSLDRPAVERAHNVCLQRVYLENELGRINAIRSGVESEVNMLLAEIKKAREWLGHPAGDEGGAEISLAALDHLRSRLALLAEEKAQKEARRQSYYDEIEECNRVLKIETRFLFDESISLLEAMAAQARAAIQLGRAEHARLAADIQKRAAYLKIKPEQFSDSVDAENLRAMGEYCQGLRAEQSRLFDTIFEKVRLELAAINEIFGIDMPDHPATEESLDMMRDAIADLLPKKDLFCEISALIEKRQLLLQKMTEFEKIASDPKRLFRSSFQLNTEEKFRNTAYPSLLKLEEKLFELIEAYEESFGRFCLSGQDYKILLRAEIDNRIINRTVFISRCDSPYRKKR